MKMDPIMGRVGDRGDVRIQSMHLPKKKNKLFGEAVDYSQNKNINCLHNGNH